MFHPAAAQHFDGDDTAGIGILRTVDPSEAPGLDLVEDLVTAQKVAVQISFEQLTALVRRQVVLPLAEEEKRLRVAAPFTDVVPGFLYAWLGDQAETDGRLGNDGSVKRFHVMRWIVNH